MSVDQGAERKKQGKGTEAEIPSPASFPAPTHRCNTLAIQKPWVPLSPLTKVRN